MAAKITPTKKFSELGIGQVMEEDRFSVDSRGSMQITKFTIDKRTKYYDKTTGTGGILKFNGFDIATGEPVKYYTTSKVLIETFGKMAEVVGFKEEPDENKVLWNVFKTPVEIDGIEMVPSTIAGHMPYPKIIVK